ncbi:radical SAM protein [Thermodesulfobacteriota bacterium]
MSGRYARLKNDWMLRGWTDRPWAVVNWTNGDQRKLRKHGAYTAQACDGKTDFNSIAFLPLHNALLDKMIVEGIAEECEPCNSINPCQRYRKADNPRLRGLHWSVTGLCNLNCRHCYMESPSRRYGELPFKDMIGLIKQFQRANVHEVSLTGGEPFLRKDLLDIVEVLAQKRIWVREICTNGLLVKEDDLERIKRAGLSPGFQISFDGVGTHEYMRGQEGIEEAAIEGIRRVRSAGFPVAIVTSIDRVSKACLFDTYNLLKELDIHSWRIASPQAIGNWRGSATGMSFEKEAEAYEPLLHRWLEDGRLFAIQLGRFFHGTGKGEPSSKERPMIRHTPENLDCRPCREKPYLLPNGTLLPCPAYTDTTLQDRMPNILRDGLSKVLSKSILRTIADMKKGDLLAKNKECISCDIFEDCGMGCRASAVLETGDLMAKDPIACGFWKKGYVKRFAELASAVK